MPNVLRRFLAMIARVPIIHIADTASTIGQGAREGQPHHDHWPPSGCLRGLDYDFDTHVSGTSSCAPSSPTKKHATGGF